MPPLLTKPNLNAPWWWKRTESALIFFLTGLIPIIGLSRTLSANATHDITLIYLPAALLSVKTVGVFFMGEPDGKNVENSVPPSSLNGQNDN